ncbi:hypothetical protein WMY93_001821 [Mugilogobius chulae]|uniref:B30.2/SPRY domain-containing protein n=1 Tax=Mugilogobius chulae TaxID=88201 RepID=A0AAW0Q0D8_9GOBI
MVPGLRKYSCDFSLDPNTAYTNMILSENNRTATRVEMEQRYPKHEDRFTLYCQVLSSSGLSGRCYWEVDWSGGDIYVAASYRRKGGECEFGYNDESWSLRITGGEYWVCHNNNVTILSHEVGVSAGEEGVSAGEESSGKKDVTSGRVGVFLDSEAGALSFYEISSEDKPFHLHSFSSSFSEPLFPGFALDDMGDSVTVLNTDAVDAEADSSLLDVLLEIRDLYTPQTEASVWTLRWRTLLQRKSWMSRVTPALLPGVGDVNAHSLDHF